MCFGLVMHWAALYFKLPFPGYTWGDDDGDGGDVENGTKPPTPTEDQPLVQNQKQSSGLAEYQSIPTWMYFFLAIPSLFDTLATLVSSADDRGKEG